MAAGRSVAIATMKNEGPYVVEWVAHALALGFDDLVICTNDCADGTDAIVRRLGRLVPVHHWATVRRAGGIQFSALRQARRLPVVQAAAWVMVLDADEFPVIDPGAGRIDDLIAAVPGTDIISLPWRVFGTGGVRAIRDLPVTRQFTRYGHGTPPPARAAFAVKSLFRNDAGYRRFGVHMPQTAAGAAPPVHRLPDGARFCPDVPPNPAAPVARVNHYPLRSHDAYLVKVDRGRANAVRNSDPVAYWRRFETWGPEDTRIRRYDPVVQPIRAALLADPFLARAQERALDWHRARARAMRADPAHAALIAAMEAQSIEGST